MIEKEAALHDRIAAWIQSEGHRTEIEVHDERYASIRFMARGFRMAVRIDATDPHFLYIFINLEIPDNIVDELLARRAAAAVEAYVKVVKVEIDWDDRTFMLAAEQLVSTPGGPDIFWRTVSFLFSSVDRIRTAFDDEAGRAAANQFTAQLEAELTVKDA